MEAVDFKQFTMHSVHDLMNNCCKSDRISAFVAIIDLYHLLSNISGSICDFRKNCSHMTPKGALLLFHPEAIAQILTDGYNKITKVTPH